jgi:hypothetical protein
MPATDPTVQTKGKLLVGLKTDINVTFYTVGQSDWFGLPVAFAGIVYGPPNAPPPAWTSGRQYFSGKGTSYGAMGPTPPSSNYVFQAGVCQVLGIPDMSTNAVVPGKTYASAISVGRQNWIQLYVRVTGGPNGSTVLPGFGLWNLITSPNAWTYVTAPEPFTGEWMIGLHSPVSFAVVWLSVEYAPPKDYGKGHLESRLLFTCAGSTVGSMVKAAGEPAPQEQDFLEQLKAPVGFQHLHERSHPHILHSGPGIPAG